MSKIMENKDKKAIVTFTVAECGEYHNFGEYHEGIKTIDEAVRIYRKIPPEHMSGIPSIGITLHVKGSEKWEDLQVDVLSGNEISMGVINLMPEFSNNSQVQEAIKEMMQRFPEKEVVNY